MGYEYLGVDFSWSIKYFDKYNNILKIERFRDDGEEIIYETKTFEYEAPETNQLSFVKTESTRERNNWEEKYVRNTNGQLTEIITTSNDNLLEKTVFKYNIYDQLTRKEVYQEDGLKTLFEYIYNTPKKDSCHIIKEIATEYQSNTKTQIEFKWSNGKIAKRWEKHYQEGKLMSDQKIYYNRYVKDMATEQVHETYEIPNYMYKDNSKETNNSWVRYRNVIKRTLNSNDDMIFYKQTITDINEKGEEIKYNLKPNKTLSDLQKYTLSSQGMQYEFKYTYNKKNEWISLLFSNALYSKEKIGIVTREIQYLD